MNRFFVNEKIGDSFILDKTVINHLTKSLRIGNKKFICVYNANFFICIFDHINNKANIIEKLDEDHEYKYDLVLAASIIEHNRFEWLIQKAAELGVKKFIPTISKYTNKKNYEYLNEKKLNRWQEIAKNACEQSFRNQIMKIEKPTHINEVISIDINNKFIAHEKNELSSQENSFNGDLLFLVGPEGGFHDDEVNLSLQNNFKSISLGKRILRAETASIYLLSKIDEH